MERFKTHLKIMVRSFRPSSCISFCTWSEPPHPTSPKEGKLQGKLRLIRAYPRLIDCIAVESVRELNVDSESLQTKEE